MAKAKFNVTCLIFWVTWLISLAYFIGSTTYRVNSVDIESFINLDIIMLVVCSCTAFLSIVGRCFLFLRVTNLPCMLAYVVPMGILVPGLCAFGIFQILSAPPINANLVIRQVMHNWKEYGTPPSYMSLTERELKCCGLYGPTDYRHFIYGNLCEVQDLDVPYTCCNLLFLLPLSDPAIRRVGKQCNIKSANIFNINATLVQQQTGILYTPVELQTPYVKCKVVNNITAKLDSVFEPQVYHERCIRHLIEASQEIQDVHYFFFIIFAMLCLIMTGFMLKDCFKIRDDGTLAAGDHPNAILIVEETTTRQAGADKKAA